MKTLPLIIVCGLVAAASVTWGASGNFGLETAPPFDGMPDVQSDASAGFLGRVELALDNRMDEVFADRLHPLRVMRWDSTNPEHRSSWLRERTEKAAAQSLAKSFEYAIRDAAVGLPIVDWLETHADLLGDLFTDTVDAVEEESVSPFELSYGAAERSWWKSLTQQRALRFGLRPIRANPYAFVGLRLQEAGRTLLLGNVRYYLQNFADHRFELALSIPMPAQLTFDLGTYYQFGRHEIERKLVVKLFRPLKRGGVAHLGIEVQREPVMFAGISLPL